MKYLLYYFSKETIETEGYKFVDSFLTLNDYVIQIRVDKPNGYRIERSNETLTEIIEENGEANG